MRLPVLLPSGGRRGPRGRRRPRVRVWMRRGGRSALLRRVPRCGCGHWGGRGITRRRRCSLLGDPLRLHRHSARAALAKARRLQQAPKQAAHAALARGRGGVRSDSGCCNWRDSGRWLACACSCSCPCPCSACCGGGYVYTPAAGAHSRRRRGPAARHRPIHGRHEAHYRQPHQPEQERDAAREARR